MIIHRFDLAIVILAIAAFWLRKRILYRRRNIEGLPLPPGPKGFPVIGNVFDMPKEIDKEWLTFADWGRKYGDIVYVESFGTPLVLLNSYEPAFELLEKRSSIYSDRPRFPMLNEIMGWDWALTLMPYGEKSRKIRQYMHRFLQPAMMKNYENIQAHTIYQLLGYLLKSPDDFEKHFRRAAGSIIMMVAYGHEVAPENDQFITLADKAIVGVNEATKPGAYLVDAIPWLKYVPTWFPGAQFKRQGKIWHDLSQAMLKTPYAMTMKNIRIGVAKPSMMSQLLDSNIDGEGRIRDEDVIKGCTAVAYAAGSDTTLSSLSSFVLAMVLYPEVQKHAQEEIDLVIGQDRLPTFDDRASLPYVDGIVRETLRWNPVLPLSPPHRLMADDAYGGYFLPAGCAVLVNQWAILHDENEYPDPMVFRPDRWLFEGSQNSSRHANKAVFGFGRRLCPGKNLADQTIFIAVSNILATFNINRAMDEKGDPIIPTGEYTTGLLSHPKPFECSIVPRSAKAATLIRGAMEIMG